MTTAQPHATCRSARPQQAADRYLAEKLERWRLRGQAARRARQDRQAPPPPRATTPEIRALVETAWLAGYDGR